MIKKNHNFVVELLHEDGNLVEMHVMVNKSRKFICILNLIELCIVDESDGWKHIVTQWIVHKLKRLKIYPLVYGWQHEDNYLTRITQDKTCSERDYNVDRSDYNISFANDMSKFINKGLQLLHLKLNVLFNFNIIPTNNTIDKVHVIGGISDARAENEMIESFYNALLDMFKNKIYLKNENYFTFKIEFYTHLTAEKEYLQCIFNKHQITCLIYSMMQIYHSVCFGIKIVFVNSSGDGENIDENEYEKMKCHFENKIINPLKSSLDFCSPFGLNTNVSLYIDSNISWMEVNHEQSFALVVKVNNDRCHTSPQFEFGCSNCKSDTWLENECCDHCKRF